MTEQDTPTTYRNQDPDYDIITEDSASIGFPEGHPLHDARKAEEDGKRVSAVDGKPAVTGLTWSQAATGLFLKVSLMRAPAPGETIEVPGTPFVISFDVEDVGTEVVSRFLGTIRRPRGLKEGFGTHIELPSDLATDGAKQEYLKFWIESSIQEVLTMGPGKLLKPGEFVASEVKIDLKALGKSLGEVLGRIEKLLTKAGL